MCRSADRRTDRFGYGVIAGNAPSLGDAVVVCVSVQQRPRLVLVARMIDISQQQHY